jgi:predicted nuclease of predicted toxin-antitoxin system
VSLPLYMDVHIPRVITDGVRLRGVDVLTAQQDGCAELPDPKLLDRATVLGRLLVTEDKHFLAESARRQRLGEPFAGILFARQLSITIRECLEDLELISRLGEPQEFANRLEYLPLRWKG